MQIMDDVDEENENSNDKDMHVLITAEIHEFSNESVQLPGFQSRTEYWKRDDELENEFHLVVFANGFSEASEGFVCVRFSREFVDMSLTGHCIISVIDVSGNKRFPRSFFIFDVTESNYAYTQYISRKNLLDDPEEYLLNDVLILRIDVYFPERSGTYVPAKHKTLPEFSFRSTKLNNDTYEVKLNSPFAKRLAEESSFFRGVLRAPMIEKSRETMLIDKKEFESFWKISNMFMEVRNLRFRSVERLFDLCIVADKYDIPTVTELCTCFLKLCLFDHTVDDYLDIINKKYDIFNEVLVNLISLVEDTDIDKEMVKERGGVRLKRPIRKRIWFYKNTFTGIRFEIVEKPPSRPPETFDFYN